MAAEKTFLQVQTRADWRKWLEAHHDSVNEIWLVFTKPHTGIPSPSYNDAVEEALCFGWVDNLISRIDDDLYARKFTPRKPDSRWSTSNRERYEELKRRGLLTAAGLARPPTDLSGDAPRPLTDTLPRYIEEAFNTNPTAWTFFQTLPPSEKQKYIGWIDLAKRDTTKQKRLAEALAMLSKNKRIGLK